MRREEATSRTRLWQSTAQSQLTSQFSDLSDQLSMVIPVYVDKNRQMVECIDGFLPKVDSIASGGISEPPPPAGFIENVRLWASTHIDHMEKEKVMHRRCISELFKRIPLSLE